MRKAFDVAPQEACGACGRTDSWEQMPVTEKDTDLSVITLMGVCFAMGSGHVGADGCKFYSL